MNRTLVSGILMATIGSIMMAPLSASAQSNHHRQDQKNQWRNIAYAAGAAGVVGLLTHNNTLSIGGLAGAAYSGYRYEQERKNQNQHRGGHYNNGSRYDNGYNGRNDNSNYDNGYSGGYSSGGYGGDSNGQRCRNGNGNGYGRRHHGGQDNEDRNRGRGHGQHGHDDGDN